MVHAGMGPTHVVNFLSTCNIPPPDPKTLRKREKDIASAIGSVSLVYFRFRFTTSGQFRENAVLLCIRLQSHNWWQTALQLIPLPN